MKSLRALYHLARADFLERVRRFGFVLILMVAVGVSYLSVPPTQASYRVLQVAGQRGLYNSAWIGLMFGLIAAMHLPLFGFFLVRNTVERDRQTGVGQIFASTPVSKLVYVLGKWFSNLALLALVLSVLTMMAAIMQLVRAEELAVNVWTLVAPIWLMGLPVLAIAAALSVLWECVPFLRGSLGSVVIVCLWLAAMGLVLSRTFDATGGLARPSNDLYGFSWQMNDIQQERLAADPQASMSSAFIVVRRDDGTFLWEGVDWTGSRLLGRLQWLLIGLAAALVAAIPFDRFDPARGRARVSAGEEPHGRRARSPRKDGTESSASPVEVSDWERNGVALIASVPLTTLADRRRRARPGTVLLAELRLMFKGQSWWWFAVAAGLIVAGAVVPSDTVRSYMLAAAWLWPLSMWSAVGTRERQHQTQQLVFSAPHSLRRQLPALWLAAFVVALVTGVGFAARLVVEGNWAALLAWSVGAAFITSLALALGTWSGSRRLFELVYLLWWYLGPVEGMPAFDFTGARSASPNTAIVVAYLGGALVLAALAVIGRRRQVHG